MCFLGASFSICVRLAPSYLFLEDVLLVCSRALAFLVDLLRFFPHFFGHLPHKGPSGLTRHVLLCGRRVQGGVFVPPLWPFPPEAYVTAVDWARFLFPFDASSVLFCVPYYNGNSWNSGFLASPLEYSLRFF